MTIPRLNSSDTIIYTRVSYLKYMKKEDQNSQDLNREGRRLRAYIPLTADEQYQSMIDVKKVSHSKMKETGAGFRGGTGNSGQAKEGKST